MRRWATVLAFPLALSLGACDANDVEAGNGQNVSIDAGSSLGGQPDSVSAPSTTDPDELRALEEQADALRREAAADEKDRNWSVSDGPQ